MLKGISPLISPELLKVLCEMGHGDMICFADSNYPVEAKAREYGCKVVRLDGQPIIPLVEAVLELFPLDMSSDKTAFLMEKQECDKNVPTPIWNEFASALDKADPRGASLMEFVDRFGFYELSGKCYCIVQTGETAIYANIILKKGVVK